MSSTLVNQLNAISPLTEECISALAGYIEVKHLAKKELLLKAGDVCRNIYFIESGILRSYYSGNEEEEVTAWFMKEGDVIISVNSFYNQTPGYEYIEAIEEAELFRISYRQLQDMYARFPEFNTIGRILTERYYSLSEERLYSMRRKSARERYEFLLEKHPAIVQRVPLQYIASYLGVSRETLSRIRNRK